MSLSPPSTFLCVAGSCTVVDKNAHTIGAIHQQCCGIFNPKNCYSVLENKIRDVHPGSRVLSLDFSQSWIPCKKSTGSQIWIRNTAFALSESKTDPECIYGMTKVLTDTI
jgi:hypothetical protein